MLYLITGVPGSGKTLKMISDLMNRNDLKNRPLYLDGIPEVNQDVIPHLPVPEGETMQTWHKWAPTGSILVIDECQRVFRPRPSGSKVPDYVAELETHRHRGIDIFLLTQHPRLVDTNVRALVGHHCHIAKTNLGVRRMLEWERCADPLSKSDVQSAVKSVYTLDKKAFGVYKSAEEHTKIRTKLSRVVYIFPVVMAVIIGAAWYVYSSWNNRLNEEKQPKPQIEAKAADTAMPPQSAASAASYAGLSGQYPNADTVQKPLEPHLSEADYQPAISGQPHTAPIYNGLNKAVQTMPYPVACVKNANKCTCYTDQGSIIKDFSKQKCLDFVTNGIYNPYKQKQAADNQIQQAQQPVQQPSQQVAVMGGKQKPNLIYDGYAEKTDKFN